MTVTLVYGDASDGYITSRHGTYSNARSGSGATLAVLGGSTIIYGQRKDGSTYETVQGFIRFAYSAVSSSLLVTSALVRLRHTGATGSGIARNLELKGHTWGPTLTTGDLNGTYSAGTFIEVLNVHRANPKMIYAGGNYLVETLPSVVAWDFMLCTSRQRAGTAPTEDERGWVYAAEENGTVYDPLLIYTTVPKSTLVPVAGAQVRLSDGHYAMLENYNPTTGTGTPRLVHISAAGGSATLVANLPIGTSSTDFAVGAGAQALALVADANDNLFVLGRSGQAGNTLAAKAYTKGAGHTWSAGTTRSTAMPSHDTSINAVAAAWFSVGSGTIHAIVGHHAGEATDLATNDQVRVLLSASYLLGLGGYLLRSVDSTAGEIVPNLVDTDYNTFTNETGTLLDIVASGTDTAFSVSAVRTIILGENAVTYVARSKLSSGGTSVSEDDYRESTCWATKDAGAKARVVLISSTVFAVVTVDADTDWGISIAVFQSTAPGSFVQLGGAALDAEGIATMPTPATLAASQVWDVVLNATENKLWIYYVSSADARRVMRTGFSLDTYQATREEVQVATGVGSVGTTVLGIRSARNGSVTQTNLVTLALLNGSTHSTSYVADAMNVAPTAPTLTAKANYDATAAASYFWTFNDPNVGDTQSAYQLQIVNVGTGVTTLDTGKVTSATASRSVAGGTLTNGNNYQWRVRTYDFADVVGPWSEYSTFSTAAGGTVTITSPATDNQAGVDEDTYPITWSVASTTQASYKVVVTRTDTNAVLVDTGYVTSVATTYTVAGMLTGVEYLVSVTVRNAALVISSAGTRLITPDYGSPEQPNLTASPSTEAGYVLLTIDNPLPGGPTLGTVPDTFEAGVTGYTGTSCTFVQSSDFAHEGTYSAKLTVTGAPATAYVRQLTANQQAVVAGTRYTVRFWAYSPAGHSNQSVTIDWYTSLNAYISTSSQTSAIAAGVWTYREVTAVAPATAAFAKYGPTLGANPPTSMLLYVDELAITDATDRPDVVRNDILRRVAGSGGAYTVLGTAEPDGSFRDYEAASGVTYEYVARGQA